MNLCKKIGKSIAIAFSMYSKIPMVQFEWKICAIQCVSFLLLEL